MAAAYRVYMTPLLSASTYGTEVEISDYVKALGGVITQSIDSTDYSVGVYTVNDVQLTCDNSKGLLSDANDSRSLFTYSRDKAKIRIVFENGDEEQTFQGLINEEGTTVQSDEDELTLTVLGPDSILRKTNIPAGTITDGMTVTQALVAILNTADVRSVLEISLANLNPKNNITIDIGSKFDNQNKKDALAELLGASNSVMIIDDDLNLIVRDRLPNYDRAILYLYGRGDMQGRENISSIQGYNTGLQRTFNTLKVEGGQATVTVTDVSSVQQDVAKTAPVGYSRSLQSQALYGIRDKALSFQWVTQQATLESIASNYVGEFAFSKIELQVKVPTPVAASVRVLDQVSVSYPLLTTLTGKFFPVIGVTKVGDTDSPLPNVKGAIAIDGELGFKVIEKLEDIGSFETTLKLRQVGVGLSDGVLIVPTSTRTITSAGSPAQITTSDDLILVDASGGDVDVHLVSPVSDPQKEYTVMRTDTSRNRVRVLPFASEYINTDQTYLELEKQNDSARFGTDRSNWWAHFRSRPSIVAAGQKRFTLTNNQASAADITGLSLNKLLYREARVVVSVRRRTDSVSEVRTRHEFIATYNAGTDAWTMQPETVTGDDDGVTLSLTSAGQVQYQSTNLSGANGVHNCDYSAEVFNV